MINMANNLRGISTAYSKVLVIGDGDGGFTHYPWCKEADFVERDVNIMKVGENYFGANWNNVGRMFITSGEDFVPDTNYDVIFLAITDSFNRTKLVEQLQHFKSWLNPDGCLVGQVGCLLDNTYETTFSNYKELGSDLFDCFDFYTDYYKGFLSPHTFFAGRV